MKMALMAVRGWSTLVARGQTLAENFNAFPNRTVSVSRCFLEMFLFPHIPEFNYIATVIEQCNSGGHGERRQK